MVYKVPVNRPTRTDREPSYMHEALARGQLSGDGPYTRRCHALLEESLGVHKVLLTTSCTHALEMAALLLDVGPRDEVIVPSFTFVSTANAFVLRGATPPAELDDLCAERLARHKRPRWTLPVAELPKTATGKIQRFRLREAASA